MTENRCRDCSPRAPRRGVATFFLDGHTAIVTGDAHGIGLATARLLADFGADVVVADLDNDAGAAAADDVQAKGGNAMFVGTDVAEAAAVDAMIEAVTRRFGSVEILMHLAGIGIERLALETTREEWDRVSAVSLAGVTLPVDGGFISSGVIKRD